MNYSWAFDLINLIGLNSVHLKIRNKVAKQKARLKI